MGSEPLLLLYRLKSDAHPAFLPALIYHTMCIEMGISLPPTIFLAAIIPIARCFFILLLLVACRLPHSPSRQSVPCRCLRGSLCCEESV